MKNTHFSLNDVLRRVVTAIAVCGLFAGGAAFASGKKNASCSPQSHGKRCTTTSTTTRTTTTTPTTTTTTTTTTPTPTTTTTTTVSPAQLVSSTITAGATLSGIVSWSVATSGDVASVEYWANGALLGTRSSSPWTYSLDTAGLPNGGNTLGVALLSSSGAQTNVQIGTVSVQNGPALASLPVVSGTAAVGQTLTASMGTWSPAASSYGTQWDRCDSSGGACAPIAGANAATYAPVSADAGSTLRIAVTASNAYGSAVATSAATAAIAAPTTAGPDTANVVWNGDFDSGTFGQYDSIQQFVTGRAAIVGSAGSLGGPAAPAGGKDFFQCRVVNGDVVYGGERCEILKGGLGISNGADQWYGWSMAMPANLPANGITGQFHSNYNYAQSNVQLFIDHGQVGAYGATSSAPRWIIGVNGGPAVPGGQYVSNTYSKAYDLGPLSNWRGAGWIDVVLHVKWSDTTNGTVELWLKKAGASTYTKYVSQVGNVATLYQGYQAYLKLGLYRPGASGLADGYIWYDQVHDGTTFASVDPSA